MFGAVARILLANMLVNILSPWRTIPILVIPLHARSMYTSRMQHDEKHSFRIITAITAASANITLIHLPSLAHAASVLPSDGSEPLSVVSARIIHELYEVD